MDNPEGRLPAYRLGRERHRRFRKQDLDEVPRTAEDDKNLENMLVLTARAAPVLAEIWDNDRDAAYDRI